jgi:2-polyprenyl-6-methoxyphenol hydroxylase-like FAD-dependent oxidoreductase
VSDIADVAIVGAGLAGASAAAVLARKGVRVVLIDSRESYPRCFKAEKIEPDQAKLLRKLGLLAGVVPFASHINEVISARNGRLIRVLRFEQYGIFYQDIVNGVRAQLPPSVTWRTARVRDISPGCELSRVTLMGGETIAARLVVLACGTGGNLHAGLGLNKHMINAVHSFTIGFNIARDDEQPFPFDSVTYYPNGPHARIAYLTLFPIRDVMRANLFVYRTPGEEWVSQFRKDPDGELVRALPGLIQATGPFRVVSRVEMCPVDLYRVDGATRAGLVLIGDAYQSVCPATGTGLSKVLMDVDALCDCVPEWLESPGMGAEKIARYYDQPQRKACDAQSLQEAIFCRTLFTDSSLRWRVYRETRYLGIRLLAWTNYSRRGWNAPC